MTAARPRVSGHFIAAPGGPLAAVVWQPPPGAPTDFAVLHVPPAGDELNKSRRMVAMQARELARRRATVALVDLRGTGDSAGEHGDATWAGWHADIVAAWTWLATLTGSVPRVLWGLRLGSLLATELVASGRVLPDALLLWQPVVAGRIFFSQWLRVASTQQMTGRGQAVGDAKSLRTMLAEGSSVEIAGYDLNPELVSGADAVDLVGLPAPRCPVLWRETTIADPALVSPAAAKVQTAWNGHKTILDFAAVTGPSFWASQELVEAPELIAATTNSLLDSLANVAEVNR
jgi:exosortase A-associated hydrolase 2